MLWAAFILWLPSILRICGSHNKILYQPNITHIDITLHYSRIHINIKASKTDPFHHGCTISKYRFSHMFRHSIITILHHSLKAWPAVHLRRWNLPYTSPTQHYLGKSPTQYYRTRIYL